MRSWRWGEVVSSIALAAGLVLFCTCGNGREVEVAPQAGAGTGLVLSGFVEAPGIDLARCQARCSSMRLESHPVIHLAELDARGRFEFAGLSDSDYCIEIVLRSNPALVLGRLEHVRPGGGEHVVPADPVRIFGPAGSADRDSQ